MEQDLVFQMEFVVFNLEPMIFRFHWKPRRNWGVEIELPVNT